MTEVTPDPKPGPKKAIKHPRFSLKLKGESKCRNCGSAGPLQLHHVIPRSKFKAGKWELLNGLTLCDTCHQKFHAHAIVLYRDLFTTKEWNYLASVTLTGEEIEEWLNKHYPTRP